MLEIISLQILNNQDMKTERIRIAIVGMDLMCSTVIDRIKAQSQEIVIVQATEQFDNKCFEIEPITLNGRNIMPALIERFASIISA